ncbi:mediator complex, subunit Med10 [Hypoxylon sp. FL0890]|nr:mediator complex, subunit Med10 [Hypoxylon sp. FL0890]
MAPMSRVDHDALEQQLKDTIQTLTNVMVQVTNYDTTTTSTSTSPPNSTSAPTLNPPSTNTLSPSSRTSRDVIANELRTLSSNLQSIHARALDTHPERALPHIPPELIQYVDNGRNPDIYTREFVELVRRGNQLARGKQSAFASFRDVLAGEMDKAMPELKDDTAGVLANTRGGRR